MKKLFLLLILLSIYHQGFSQKLGVKAGLNLSTYNTEEAKMTTGFMAGPTIEFASNGQFSMLSGLIYSQKGASVDENISGVRDSKLAITYIDVPLLAKLSLGTNKENSSFFTAGPYLSYALKAQAQRTVNGYTVSANMDFKDGQLRRFDAGLSLGGGVQFGSVTVGADYSLGLIRIGKDNGSPKNRWFCFSVGYIFHK